MARFRLAPLIGLILLGGCASTPEGVQDRITIALRTPGICLGVCPNVDMTVWPDGRVLVARYNSDEVERFRVSPTDAARFRAILTPYRPSVAPQQEPVCARDIHDEPPPGAEAPDIAITWSDRSTVRLAACLTPENAALIETISEALAPIDLYLTGTRVSASRRREFWWRVSFGLLH